MVTINVRIILSQKPCPPFKLHCHIPILSFYHIYYVMSVHAFIVKPNLALGNRLKAQFCSTLESYLLLSVALTFSLYYKEKAHAITHTTSVTYYRLFFIFHS